MTSPSLTTLQLIVLRSHFPKPISALIRRGLIHISTFVRRHLRKRTDRFVRWLGVGFAAEHWNTLSIEMIRCFALFDPIDERVQSCKWESTISAHAVRHAGDFKIAQVVIRFGCNFFDSLVVIETAIGWDEFVGEAVPIDSV